MCDQVIVFSVILTIEAIIKNYKWSRSINFYIF